MTRHFEQFGKSEGKERLSLQTTTENAQGWHRRGMVC